MSGYRSRRGYGKSYCRQKCLNSPALIYGEQNTGQETSRLLHERGTTVFLPPVTDEIRLIFMEERQMTYVIIMLIIIVMILIITNIRIIPQSKAAVVERLGAYQQTWNTGLHVKIPFIDRIAKVVSLKEQVFDFEPQPVITKDNVTMMIDSVIFFQITDPKLYCYGVERPISAIENLSATTLRNIIGELELDQTLTSRDVINNKLRSILDEATDPWGIKVNRVEVKNIKPPESIQEAMEKQMRAERERREAILIAEGKKQSAILVAEGEKQSVILAAEGKKEANIREAEGQAQAILDIQKATAAGLKMIKDIQADPALIKLRSLEAFEKAADGKATKIIIPSDIQDLAGIVTSIAEIAQTKRDLKTDSSGT